MSAAITDCMTHSPGPWTVGTTAIWAGEPPNDKAIARVTSDYTFDFENAFDERLIEAAPDLLAVCQETLTKLEYLQGEGVVQMPRTIDILKAAIAKAMHA